MSKERCDLIMASWNAADMTRRALESIHKHSAFPYRLIVVDNASDQETVEMLESAEKSMEFGELKLIRNNRNIGWLAATNQGLQIADGEYVCLINNDIVAGKNWLLNCINLMRKEPKIGLINPRGNERSENRSVTDINTYATQLERLNHQRFTELDHCSGFCLIIRTSILSETGYLDPVYGEGYYEDYDLSRRAQELGWLCAQADDAFVFHLGSQSFKNKVPERRQELISINREIFERRWGKLDRKLLLFKRNTTWDELINMARSSKIYVLQNDHLPNEQCGYKHNNLTILKRRGIIPEIVRFGWSTWYLARKGRIDVAEVLIRATNDSGMTASPPRHSDPRASSGSAGPSSQ